MKATTPFSAAKIDMTLKNDSELYDGASACSVLVVGGGPAGLMLACNLVRFGIDVQIVDDRPDKTATGRADGLQPKTIETFRHLGLADGLLRKGVKIYDICFWNSTAKSPLSRTNREIHYPASVDTLNPYVLLVHQGMIEDVFLDDLRSHGVEVIRSSPFVGCTEDASKGVVESICRDNTTGQERKIRSNYVVGCDGAHSKVRKCIPEAKMVGESGKAAWGVLDGVIETDFPDIWSKAVVHSEESGSMLCIPRERNMTRLYIELNPGTTQPIADEIANQEFVIRRAKEILHPFHIEWKSIEWFSVYRVGQRVASHFMSPARRTFLAGDAAHTHSPKAAQGMNVSMHDTFNLAWKLNLSLRNVALPSQLETYEDERKQIAQQLIDFDFEHANAFLTGDAEALAKNFDDNIRFISGVGVNYGWNVLNKPQYGLRHNNGRLKAGALLLPARVTRYIDANPVDIHLDIPLLSQFRIYLFVSDIHVSKPFLEAICEFLNSTKSVLGRASLLMENSYKDMRAKMTEADEYNQPGRYTNASKLFSPAIVTTMKKREVEINDLPNLLQKSPWTFYLDDIISVAGNCTEKWLGNLDTEELVIINVRPDGYVGHIGRFYQTEQPEALKQLDEYYGNILKQEEHK